MYDTTVIIPTLATKERVPFLERAIESTLAQGDDVSIVVVTNGPDVDQRFIRSLGEHEAVTVAHQRDRNLPKALEVGRSLVGTRFFSELDDDDEFLPGTLASRRAVLSSDSEVDVVVSNTLISAPGAPDEFSISDIAFVERSPVSSLLQRNWMVPGSALFRTASVTEKFFTDIPKFLEWTYLGLRVARELNVRFLESPGSVHHTGLPFSVNDSLECVLTRPANILVLQNLDLLEKHRRILRGKESALWHAAAEALIERRHLSAAFKAHLKSARLPFGVRYWGYTRYFLSPLLRGFKDALLKKRTPSKAASSRR